MRSAALPSQRVLLKATASHSWPSSLPPNFNQFPFHYKPSCSNRTLVFVRNLRKQGVEVNDGGFGHFLRRALDSSEGSKFRAASAKAAMP